MEFFKDINNTFSNGPIDYYEVILSYVVCLISGFLIMYCHSNYGFKYFRDKFHIYIGLLLPVIGYTITTVIGTNLALSLGMIGALSIIRFRTPVRSSYELVIYFLLLTVGISAKADIGVCILLTIVSIILIFILKKYYDKPKNDGINSNKNLLIEMNFNNDVPVELLNHPKLVSIIVKKNSDKKSYVNCNLNIEDDINIKRFLDEWKDCILSYEIHN